MSKAGEIAYYQNIGELGRKHAAGKPFTDENCHLYLEDFAAILQLIPRPPARLLDMGCGTGWTSLFFARCGYEVVGVDISSDMIAEANRQRDHDGLSNATFAATDYEQLTFDNEFDVVVFFDSLHHAIDELLAITCAYKALKPGGVCMTREPGVGHETNKHALDAAATYDVTEKDMPPSRIFSLGNQAGFREFHAFPHASCARVIPFQRSAESCIRVSRPNAHRPHSSTLFNRLVTNTAAKVRMAYRKAIALPGKYSRSLFQAAMHHHRNAQRDTSQSGITLMLK